MDLVVEDVLVHGISTLNEPEEKIICVIGIVVENGMVLYNVNKKLLDGMIVVVVIVFIWIDIIFIVKKMKL